MREQQENSRQTGRDFAEVFWQIGEKRQCDEVLVHYDCGHRMRAETWVPALPNSREYNNHEAERRRYMQHSFHVLTKDPGAAKVQIIVPEGRCRHCGYGQRHFLLCGAVQVELMDEKERAAVGAFQLMRQMSAPARRIELTLSCHDFLAAVSQVCHLSDDVIPPSLLQDDGALGTDVFKPVEGTLPAHECSQYSRKDIEDELRSKVEKYKGGAVALMLGAFTLCCYFTLGWFGSGVKDIGISWSMVREISNITSSTAMERLGVDKNPWLLSSLAFVVRMTSATVDGVKEGSAGPVSSWFDVAMSPLRYLFSFVLVTFFWIFNVATSVPCFFFNQLCTLLYGMVWCPCCWLVGLAITMLSNPVVIFRFVSNLVAMDQVSMMRIMNAMFGAALLSVLVAVLSAPHPLSLCLRCISGELPSLGLAKGKSNKRKLARLWPRKNAGKPRGGQVPAKSQKEKQTGGGRSEHGDGSDKNCLEPLRSRQFTCFVCLDRPSHYMLEPCGHHVVCGDCAMELVEAASRVRPLGEAPASHRPSEKSGGSCPSCGITVKQAVRVFN